MSNETDRELLEMVARAIKLPLGGGYGEWYQSEDGSFSQLVGIGESATSWNPLTDDGDEARLEADLSLDVEWAPGSVGVMKFDAEPVIGAVEFFDDHAGDRQAARRRAGVRAAAEIGRAMK